MSDHSLRSNLWNSWTQMSDGTVIRSSRALPERFRPRRARGRSEDVREAFHQYDRINRRLQEQRYASKATDQQVVAREERAHEGDNRLHVKVPQQPVLHVIVPHVVNTADSDRSREPAVGRSLTHESEKHYRCQLDDNNRCQNPDCVKVLLSPPLHGRQTPPPSSPLSSALSHIAVKVAASRSTHTASSDGTISTTEPLTPPSTSPASQSGHSSSPASSISCLPSASKLLEQFRLAREKVQSKAAATPRLLHRPIFTTSKLEPNAERPLVPVEPLGAVPIQTAMLEPETNAVQATVYADSEVTAPSTPKLAARPVTCQISPGLQAFLDEPFPAEDAHIWQSDYSRRHRTELPPYAASSEGSPSPCNRTVTKSSDAGRSEPGTHRQSSWRGTSTGRDSRRDKAQERLTGKSPSSLSSSRCEAMPMAEDTLAERIRMMKDQTRHDYRNPLTECPCCNRDMYIHKMEEMPAHYPFTDFESKPNMSLRRRLLWWPHSVRLGVITLLELALVIGNGDNAKLKRHAIAPYAFTPEGRPYAEYDMLPGKKVVRQTVMEQIRRMEAEEAEKHSPSFDDMTGDEFDYTSNSDSGSETSLDSDTDDELYRVTPGLGALIPPTNVKTRKSPTIRLYSEEDETGVIVHDTRTADQGSSGQAYQTGETSPSVRKCLSVQPKSSPELVWREKVTRSWIPGTPTRISPLKAFMGHSSHNSSSVNRPSESSEPSASANIALGDSSSTAAYNEQNQEPDSSPTISLGDSSGSSQRTARAPNPKSSSIIPAGNSSGSTQHTAHVQEPNSSPTTSVGNSSSSKTRKSVSDSSPTSSTSVKSGSVPSPAPTSRKRQYTAIAENHDKDFIIVEAIHRPSSKRVSRRPGCWYNPMVID